MYVSVYICWSINETISFQSLQTHGITYLYCYQSWLLCSLYGFNWVLTWLLLYIIITYILIFFHLRNVWFYGLFYIRQWKLSSSKCLLLIHVISMITFPLVVDRYLPLYLLKSRNLKEQLPSFVFGVIS